ncbi:hypothetical protein [Flindersiella endophytica]
MFEQTCNGLKLVVNILRILKPIISVSLRYLALIVVVAIVLSRLGFGWIAVPLWAAVPVHFVARLVSFGCVLHIAVSGQVMACEHGVPVRAAQFARRPSCRFAFPLSSM